MFDFHLGHYLCVPLQLHAGLHSDCATSIDLMRDILKRLFILSPKLSDLYALTEKCNPISNMYVAFFRLISALVPVVAVVSRLVITLSCAEHLLLRK